MFKEILFHYYLTGHSFHSFNYIQANATASIYVVWIYKTYMTQIKWDRSIPVLYRFTQKGSWFVSCVFCIKIHGQAAVNPCWNVSVLSMWVYTCLCAESYSIYICVSFDIHTNIMLSSPYWLYINFRNN